MTSKSIPLPPELISLVISFLPRRRNLWSLSLVCWRLNIITTPHLYKTVLIELQAGVSIAPGMMRSLIMNPQHSKVNLIKEICIVSQFDDRDEYDMIFKDYGSGCASTLNEMLIYFIHHLQSGQLCTFVWRCNHEMSPRLITLLASYHPIIKYLYIQRIKHLHELKNETGSIFSMFSSLKGFSWHGIRYSDEIPIFSDILQASAASLESLSFTIDPKARNLTSGVENMTQQFNAWDDSPNFANIVLASLVEYQIPGLQLHLDKLRSSSKIQRLYLTEEIDKQTTEDLLLSFCGLVEINLVYRGELPSKEAIFNHGQTLRVLSICSGSKIQDLPEVWSTDDLIELGRKCPKLVELGLNYYGRDPRSSSFTGTTGQSTSANPGSNSISFPRHHFDNLELLYISLPDNRGNTEARIRRYNPSSVLHVPRLLRDVEESLNGYGFCRRYAGIPVSSKKLKVVTLGIGNIEMNACLGFNPIIWRAIYQYSTAEIVKLEQSDMWNALNSGFFVNWRLLRRYPLLIPTEGLSHISR